MNAAAISGTPEPGLNLYMSNRLEILAGELAAIMAAEPLPPLQAEIVVVQSRGMARWLAMQLAERLGVCANLSCPFPNSFLREIFSLIAAAGEAEIDRETVTWRLLALLTESAGRPLPAPLKGYLADGRELKRYQLARRLADLFDQYPLYRPEMVLAWDEGREGPAEGWQAELWRRLTAGASGSHRAAFLQRALAVLEQSGAVPAALPPRLTVFGISSLPPYHLRVLAALSRHLQVNFLLLNPCREYWGDIISRRELGRIGRGGGEAALLYREEGNSLLASMGQLGRDFFDLLQELGGREHERYAPAGDGTLLAAVQNEILELREPTAKIVLSEADHSIAVHSCHSPLRELEVLKDQLLALFEANPDLEPREILVMTPDIELYGPLVQAVFDEPPEAPARIPYSIADRTFRREARLAEIFLTLLDLAGSRFEAPRLMGLLEEAAVRRRFGLEADDLKQLQQWVADASIRWGVDEQCRLRRDLPAFAEHSWRAGLDRLLLGYAMAGDQQQLFAGILPLAGAEGSAAPLLGRLLDFVETVVAVLRPLSGSDTPGGWAAKLLLLIERCFAPDEEWAGEILQLRGVLLELADQERLAGTLEVGLETVRAHLAAAFEQESSASGFLTGGVTFCAMLPMRAIPFKVICLLGLNDAAFPRPLSPLSFDLMAREVRRGDRSRRADDRYLFLEALLSARERFYLSYVGQSARDGSQLPPSVLVSELLDYLERGFEAPGGDLRGRLITSHRLQPFAAEYFQEGSSLFSYGAEDCRAARALLAERRPQEPLLTAPLGAAEEKTRVELTELVRFFHHPVRYFYQQRLGLRIEEAGQELADREPFRLEGLDRYQLATHLLDRELAGREDSGQFLIARAAGLLPPGAMGEIDYQELGRETQRFSRRLAGQIEGEKLEPLEVELLLAGFRLSGRLTGCRRQGLLSYRCATVKPKDQIGAWLAHLLLNHAAPAGYPRESLLVGKDRSYRFAAVSAGTELLTGLLALFRRGRREPLPLFPAASLAYAEALRAGKGEKEGLRRARLCWLGNDFGGPAAEGNDNYHRLHYRGTDPLDVHFQQLALDFFLPLLEQRTEDR